MRKYHNTYLLDTLIYLIDETYPSDFFRRAYDDVSFNPSRDASLEEEAARCLVNVILQNYSGDSSPERNLQRIAGEVDRFARLVSEVQMRLAEIGEVCADQTEALVSPANKPIRS